MLIEQEKSLLGSKETLAEKTNTVTPDLLIKFFVTKNEKLKKWVYPRPNHNKQERTASNQLTVTIASHIVEKILICTLSRHSAVSYVLCYLREVCKQANLIALTTQLADYHAHSDTDKITCELES